MSSNPMEDQSEQSFLRTLELCRRAQMMKIRLQRIGSRLAPSDQDPTNSSSPALTHTSASESSEDDTLRPDLSSFIGHDSPLPPPRTSKVEYTTSILGKRKTDGRPSLDEKIDKQKPRTNLYQYLLAHRPNDITTTSISSHDNGKLPSRHSIEVTKESGNRPLGSRGSFGRSTSITIRLSSASFCMNEPHDGFPSACLSDAPAKDAVLPGNAISAYHHLTIPAVIYSPFNPSSVAKDVVFQGPDEAGRSSMQDANVETHPQPLPDNPSAFPLDLPPSPNSPASVLSFPSSFASTKAATTPSPISSAKQAELIADPSPVVSASLLVEPSEPVRHGRNSSGVTSPSPTLAPRYQPPTGPTASWPDFGYLGSGAR